MIQKVNIADLKIEDLLAQISLAAHDLNNALSVIYGYPDLLLSGIVEQHKFNFFLEQIKLASSKAADSTNQLLALGRCAKQDNKTVDLVKLLKLSIAHFQANVAQVESRVVFVVSDTEPEINFETVESLFMHLFESITHSVTIANGFADTFVFIKRDDSLKICWKIANLIKFIEIESKKTFQNFVEGMIIASLNAQLHIDEDEPMVELIFPSSK